MYSRKSKEFFLICEQIFLTSLPLAKANTTGTDKFYTVKKLEAKEFKSFLKRLIR